MIEAVWLFLRAAYDFLMRVSVPLLVAGIVLLTVSGGLIWKWGIADHGRKVAERKVDALDRANGRLKSDLASCHASVDELTDSLEKQNAAVDLLKSESDARAKRAAAAVRAAQEQARGMQRTISKLQAARPSGDVCTSARSLIVETLGAER
jgi:parvulin-like peptidyl-prolyl isomerase